MLAPKFYVIHHLYQQIIADAIPVLYYPFGVCDYAIDYHTESGQKRCFHL